MSMFVKKHVATEVWGSEVPDAPGSAGGPLDRGGTRPGAVQLLPLGRHRGAEAHMMRPAKRREQII